MHRRPHKREREKTRATPGLPWGLLWGANSQRCTLSPEHRVKPCLNSTPCDTGMDPRHLPPPLACAGSSPHAGCPTAQAPSPLNHILVFPWTRTKRARESGALDIGPVSSVLQSEVPATMAPRVSTNTRTMSLQLSPSAVGRRGDYYGVVKPGIVRRLRQPATLRPAWKPSCCLCSFLDLI